MGKIRLIAITQKRKGGWKNTPLKNLNLERQSLILSPMEVPFILPEMKDDVLRIKGNYVVDNGLEITTALQPQLSLNQIAIETPSREDYSHLMQLIRYSVSGYGGLSSVSKTECEEMDLIGDLVYEKRLNTEYKETPAIFYRVKDKDGKKHWVDFIAQASEFTSIEVFNNVAYPIQKMQLNEQGQVVFKENATVKLILNRLQEICKNKNFDYSFNSHFINTCHYAKETEKQVKNFVKIMQKIIADSKDSEEAFTNLLNALQERQYEASHALSLTGVSFDEWFAKYGETLSERVSGDIQHYAQLVKIGVVR